MIHVVFVGIGGAIGSVLRYTISLIPCRSTFPLLTLITNLLGAILIGYITGLAIEKHLSQNTVLFFKTGLCGGFTTFSTFSLEAHNLLQNGNYTYAVIYILLSLAGSLIGVLCGMKLA